MKNKPTISKTTQMCGVDYAFKRIGGKYKGRVLWHLNSKTVLRYGELSRALPDITTKMLTQALRELEEYKLINRKMFLEVPPKVEYSLSSTGQELVSFIEHLNNWGKKQMENELLQTTINQLESTIEICQ